MAAAPPAPPAPPMCTDSWDSIVPLSSSPVPSCEGALHVLGHFASCGLGASVYVLLFPGLSPPQQAAAVAAEYALLSGLQGELASALVPAQCVLRGEPSLAWKQFGVSSGSCGLVLKCGGGDCSLAALLGPGGARREHLPLLTQRRMELCAALAEGVALLHEGEGGLALVHGGLCPEAVWVKFEPGPLGSRELVLRPLLFVSAGRQQRWQRPRGRARRRQRWRRRRRGVRAARAPRGRRQPAARSRRHAHL